MTLQRQLKKQNERRSKKLLADPEVRFLAGVLFGLYESDKQQNAEQFNEHMDRLRDYCRRSEAEHNKR